MLVSLLSNDIPEVHRSALGALLNLSRGYENDENKRSIKNCGGIDTLSALLVRSRDSDVRELVTGLLWNLSSLGVSITASHRYITLCHYIICFDSYSID